MEDDTYFQQTCSKIIETRTRTTETLRKLGFTVLDSQANFVLASHPVMAAKAIFEALKAQGVFVRYFSLPRVDNHLRITIGTDAEMDKLFAALQKIL